ncbi:MAG TPA: MFS transporter [Victivallales bacterium]|nr:MFS transporter [Victivallales bacterium]
MNKINMNKKKLLTLIAMTCSLSMILIDQTIVAVTLPKLQDTFAMSNDSVQWVVNAYILSLAVMVATGGRLGDIFGRVKTFNAGAVIFACASVGCGFAVSGDMLISFRILQGIGAALMQPASMAIVNNTFEFHERGRAMAIYSGVAMSFLAVGPVLGGFFTQYLTWRLAFFINVPIAALALILTFAVKPDDKVIPEQKIDYRGFVLLFFAAGAFIIGIQQANVWGFLSSKTILLVVFGIVVFYFFVRNEQKADHPLINFSLFKNSSFLANTAILFCVQFASIAQSIYVALYIQNVLGYSPFNTGLFLIISVIMVAVITQIGGRLFDRYGVKLPCCMGLSFVGFSFFYLAIVFNFQNIYLLIPSLITMGMGVGLIMGPVNTDALNRVSDNFKGQASGIIQTARQIGGTFGIAVMSCIVNGIYFVKVSNIAIGGKLSHNIGADTLFNLLSQPKNIRQDVLSKISSDWISIQDNLRSAFSQSITHAYFVAGIVIVLGLIIALRYQKMGRLCDEVQTAEKKNNYSIKNIVIPVFTYDYLYLKRKLIDKKIKLYFRLKSYKKYLKGRNIQSA